MCTHGDKITPCVLKASRNFAENSSMKRWHWSRWLRWIEWPILYIFEDLFHVFAFLNLHCPWLNLIVVQVSTVELCPTFMDGTLRVIYCSSASCWTMNYVYVHNGMLHIYTPKLSFLETELVCLQDSRFLVYWLFCKLWHYIQSCTVQRGFAAYNINLHFLCLNLFAFFKIQEILCRAKWPTRSQVTFHCQWSLRTMDPMSFLYLWFW